MRKSFLSSFLPDGNKALGLSAKYMKIRCLSLIPQMTSYICFAAFRGMLGTLSFVWIGMLQFMFSKIDY